MVAPPVSGSTSEGAALAAELAIDSHRGRSDGRTRSPLAEESKLLAMRHDLDVRVLRDIAQDAHLNFLVGAGASAGLFRCLGDIEEVLTDLDSIGDVAGSSAIARASVYAEYFSSVLYKNKILLARAGESASLTAAYSMFLRSVNQILLRRHSSILSKQANIYTTNVDLALEDTSELLGLNANDGFSGRFHPRFSTTNYGSILSRRSLQYDNLSEVPTLNLFKLHGSVGWVADEEKAAITFDASLAELEAVAEALRAVQADLLPLTDESSAATLLTAAAGSTADLSLVQNFMSAYERLPVVNPTKTKFQQTVMNQNYYDLLRLFTNELEKENSALFLIGFSCRDEHIRELLLRACRSNPTLQVFIFAYRASTGVELQEVFRDRPLPNDNMLIIAPPPSDPSDEERYTLERVTEKFLAPIAPMPGDATPEPPAPSGPLS